MTDAKRILILTADAGFGHRSAANAIAAALQETHGKECLIEIVNPLEDKRTPAFLRDGQADYDRIVREMPDLYKISYRASAGAVPSTLVENALTVILFEVMREIVRRHRPDVIVTTYPLYQAPLRAVYAISRRYIPLFTIVTDLATVHRLWFHDAVDFCFVPTPTVRDLAIEYGLSPAQTQITGIPVHPHLAQDRDPAALRAELGWRTDLKTVLAVGSARVEHLAEVAQVLNHSGLPVQLVLVAGGDEKLYRQLQSVEWHVVTHLYNFVKDMPTLMRAADCIICKAGGLIVTEALACGLPLLLIDVLPGQEVGNAEYVIQGGAGERASNPIEALEIMYHWLERDGERLAARARNARYLGHPRAAYEIADKIWVAAERGPRAKIHHRRLGLRSLTKLLSRYNVPWEEKRPANNDDPTAQPAM